MRSTAVRSSVKNNDNLKKSFGELKILVLKLPKTQIFTEQCSDADAVACLKGFQDDFSNATGADQQLMMVNTLIRHFISEGPWVLNDKILCQILCDMHFHAPLKHPIRNAILKVLQKEALRKGVIIPESLLKSVTESNEALIEKLDKNNIDLEAMKDFVTSLSGYFENFIGGVSSLEPYFRTLLETLQRLIGIYMEKLDSNDLSPAKRSEFYVDLHNAIRVSMSCMQQYQTKITDSSIVQPILTQCWFELLDKPVYNDLPIDTKTNCGILKVFYDRHFGNIFGPREKILSQFGGSDVLSKELYYGIAIINTITEKDFSESNFYVAMNVIVEHLIEVGKDYIMDSCIVVGITRALVQYSKKVVTFIRRLSNELSSDDIHYLKLSSKSCLRYVWLNVQHSIDSIRYITYELLRNLLRLGHEHENFFDDLVNETVAVTKMNSTNEALVCLLLDYLSQALNTERVLIEIHDIQQRILKNIFKDSCWASSYERLMLTNCNEIGFDVWCDRWIKPLLNVDASEWRNDFTRLKTIRNLFERALKTKSEAAEYILAQPEISIEIYLFVLWTMRRSGRKTYSPENYRASADENVLYAKVHPLDDIRILAFRILIECHKTSEKFPVEDLNEILDFFRYNCNSQNPAIRQQIETSTKKLVLRLECGYGAARRATKPGEVSELCTIYRKFLRDMVEFCLDWCLFDGANFGRRSIGSTTLLTVIETWQKLLPNDRSIYTEKLWIRLQHTLADSYVVNKEAAIDILAISWKFFPEEKTLIHSLDDLKRLTTTFRPYDTMTAAHYLVFCAFSQSYFQNQYEAIIWCENLLDEGIKLAKISLMQAARSNSLFGTLLCIRHLLARVDFAKISEPKEIQNWRLFFERFIPKWIEVTNVVASVVNSSAPEGHLPADLNDESHFVPTNDETNGFQIKLTPQIILLCAWRSVRESSLLLGDIALRTPVITPNSPNGLITVNSMLQISLHFQHLLAVTKHRGAFEQTFVGFTNLCLRLWQSNEPELHSCPMRLVKKIAATIAGEKVEDDGDAVFDLNKLCWTRRSAGIPFMIQGIVATEIQVCSSNALTFCMTTFLEIARTGDAQEARTHSLNILRALFKCTELGEAVSEYISDGIECSIRGYSAASWPERNSSTLLFSALMTRVFGVQRSKEIENVSIKNKMTGRVFFIRHPKLYDFFYTELKSASEAILRNERPPRLHPLLLIISRLYPSALEGCDSNLKLSTYIPFISLCSSSPELVTRQLSAKSMTALISPENIAERLFQILNELKTSSALNAIHGYLLQIFYLLRSSKQQDFDIPVETLTDFLNQLCAIQLPRNNVLGKTYLEILLEILLIKRLHPLSSNILESLIDVRRRFIETASDSSLYNQLTQSYAQKSFTIFNMLLSICLESTEENLPVLNVQVSNTHHEVLETQLNIWHLMLLRGSEDSSDSRDVYHYEIEFTNFVGSNEKLEKVVFNLLPAVHYLYTIMENRKQFYPFGTIKAYEILSLLLKSPAAFEQNSELRRLSVDELLQIIRQLEDCDEIDEIKNPMWRFINAHLSYHQISCENFDTEKLSFVLSSIKTNTQSYKSTIMRRAATETLSLLGSYFTKSNDSIEFLIRYAELLLTLLRDADVCIRNRAAEIVMNLIQKGNTKHVIPLAAEDFLLDWLDQEFKSKSNECETWISWHKLLQKIYSDDDDDSVEENRQESDDNNLLDVVIFEADEHNTFDEVIYTHYKCYKKLLSNLKENGSLEDKGNDIQDEFPLLKPFFLY